MQITRTHGVGFPMGQVAKKLSEAARMLEHGEHPAAANELLDCIVYCAAAWIALQERHP